ncbi:MAG: frmR [Proteobacteria bacterium]|nr:frmR [Pseudomonadota bacterium]
MPHTLRDRKPLLARVRRIKGQMQALETLLEEAGDCAAVLQQIAAVRGAVAGLMTQVLEGHIREHLGAPEATPEERGQDVEQVVAVLRSYLR